MPVVKYICKVIPVVIFVSLHLLGADLQAAISEHLVQYPHVLGHGEQLGQPRHLVNECIETICQGDSDGRGKQTALC